MKKLFFILLLFISLQGSAQDAAQIQKEKMEALSLWPGEWDGEGWIMQADRKKHFFTQKETVISKFDGAVLTVEGVGKDKETGLGIHDAFGLFTYDVVKQQYKFIALTAMGYITDVVPEVKNNDGFVWTLNNSGYGTIRFTLKFTADEWIETGEFSKDDGKTWFPNFEMKLKKVK